EACSAVLTGASESLPCRLLYVNTGRDRKETLRRPLRDGADESRRKERDLLSQKGLGVFAARIRQAQQCDPPLPSWDNGGHRSVIDLHKFRGASWPERDTAYAARAAKVLAGQRDLIPGLAFIGRDFLNLRRDAAAHPILRDLAGARGFRALNAAARLSSRPRRLDDPFFVDLRLFSGYLSGHVPGECEHGDEQYQTSDCSNVHRTSFNGRVV